MDETVTTARTAGEGQPVPVRIYQTADRIMLAAPMPGLEPEDILVVVDGRHVTLHGRQRGPHQHDRDLLITEWTLGPYRREVDLVEAVDPALVNATYDNGVLVLSMPKRAGGASAGPVEIRLDAIEATRGERVGHMGRDIVPSTTAEHRRGKHAGRGAAGTSAVSSGAAGRAAGGYAHVNIWRFNDRDDPSDTGTARAVADRLRAQPGFRSYTVVRTAAHEVVAVTVFDSEAALRAAVGAVADLVRARVRPLAPAGPERRQGPILHHAAAA